MDKIQAFGSTGTSEKSTRMHKASDLTYDDAFKRVFKRKDVLAGILVNIVPEYKDLDVKEVQTLIKGSDFHANDARIVGVEDVGFPKKVVYDVCVECELPSGITAAAYIIFDLEMQRQYNLMYPIANRAIYYTSRLLSGQLDKSMKYDSLAPVYSAWICTHGVPKELQNTATSIRLTATNSAGADVSSLQDSLRLINVDLLLLSDVYKKNSGDAAIVKFLQSIFHDMLSDRDMNPYVTPDEDLKKEVELIMTKAEEYEREREIERKIGIEIGREEGTIKGSYETALELTDDETAIRMTCKKYNLTEERVRDILGLVSI